MGEDDRIDATTLAAALAGSNRINLARGGTVSLASPVILDLDGKGVQTVARTAGGVRYDLDGDGLADATSWIGATEGFLFLDRDGNGTVTNAGEFGFVADLPGATSDLQGLKAFDSNRDGVLSATDARFGDFRIWQDRNGNGVAETSEILTLAGAGVRSIALTATTYTGTNAPDDVAIVAKGSYTRTNGTTMDLLDAALTYVSAARDGLPTLDVARQTQDRKASDYRIAARDGRLVVVPRHGGDPVDPRAGGLSGAVELDFRRLTVGMLTAIVLDLDGDGVTLAASDKSRGWFDMNGDGSPDRQGWAGRRDGFLVIDRDGDGRIANGAELSLLAEDPTAGSSLAALAKLDSNADKIIDKTDARFGELKVWTDSNGNGVTDDGELKTLGALGIQSISLDARATGARVKPGANLLMATATFTYANGTKRTLGDAALAFRPSQPAPTIVEPSAVAQDTNGASPVSLVTRFARTGFPMTSQTLDEALGSENAAPSTNDAQPPVESAATAPSWLAAASHHFVAAISTFDRPDGTGEVQHGIDPARFADTTLLTAYTGSPF